MPPFAIIALILILARAIAEVWLSRLNQHHVRAHANEVPHVFRGIIDAAMYRRSVDYTLAKGRFGDIANLFDAVLLIAVLFSGILPWAFGRAHRLSHAQYRSDGWQQTLAPLQRVLHRVRAFSKSRSVRHPRGAAHRA